MLEFVHLELFGKPRCEAPDTKQYTKPFFVHCNMYSNGIQMIISIIEL